MERRIEDLVQWLRQQVKNAGGKGLVFGMSGGIDSAVVGALAKEAFPETSLGLIMPIHSNPKDEEDARLVGKALDLPLIKVDLSETYDALIRASGFTSDSTMALSNVKPRLRMATLYYYGQDRGYLVLGSSNASEFYIGYYTKYGDSGSDMMPLAGFLKDEVYDLARELGIPTRIIEKQPTAGLWEGQTDEDEMGFSYEELNEYIRTGKEGPHVDKIRRMHKNSEHKRKFPPIYGK